MGWALKILDRAEIYSMTVFIALGIIQRSLNFAFGVVHDALMCSLRIQCLNDFM